MEEITMKTFSENTEETIFSRQYGTFIFGEFVDTKKGDIHAINAANGKVLSKITRGNEQDVNQALKAATDAFENWPNTPVEERATMLHKIADILEENQKHLK